MIIVYTVFDLKNGDSDMNDYLGVYVKKSNNRYFFKGEIIVIVGANRALAEHLAGILTTADVEMAVCLLHRSAQVGHNANNSWLTQLPETVKAGWLSHHEAVNRELDLSD